jgi:hypothetical protein
VRIALGCQSGSAVLTEQKPFGHMISYAMDTGLTLKAAAGLKLGFVTEAKFDRAVDQARMVRSCVAQVS